MPKIFHSFVSVVCWWNKSCSEYLFVYWSLLILCNLLCIYKCIVSHLSFFSKFLIHSVKWFAKKILRRYLFFCPGQVCCHCLIFVRDHAWWVGFVKENKIIHGFFLFASCFFSTERFCGKFQRSIMGCGRSDWWKAWSPLHPLRIFRVCFCDSLFTEVCLHGARGMPPLWIFCCHWLHFPSYWIVFGK